MKVILAVNHEALEDYIVSISEINVINRLRVNKEIIKECKNEQPDVIVIAHGLPGSDDIKDILIKLTSKDFTDLRIIYLYGEEDEKHKTFINFLISRGIYDYHVGDLNTQIINDLLFKPKTRNDVKGDILDKIAIETLEDRKGTGEKNEKNIKTVIKTVIEQEVVYKPYTLKQKLISVEGSNGVGKTTLAVNMAVGLAQGLRESMDSKIILIDANFKKPDIAYHIDIVDNERCFDALIPKLKAKTLDVRSLEDFLVIPFKEYPNFKVLTGALDYSENHQSLGYDDLNYLLNTIKNSYDIIIVDTDGDIENRWTKFFHNNAHMNILVTDLNIATLEHQKKLALKMLNNKEINYEPKKYFLIVNKHFDATEFEVEDISSCLEMNDNEKFSIPFNISITDSINKAKPLILEDSEQNKVTKEIIKDICSKIHPINVEVKSKKGILKKAVTLFKKK